MTAAKKKKKTYFPETKVVRLAPLQLQFITYLLERFPNDFKTESDVIRKSITLQAKTLLSAAEYEMVCNLAYKDMPVETR